MDQWGHLEPAPDPFLNLFLAAAKNPNAPQITAVVQLLICHVLIYVVATIVRTTIVKNELTLMSNVRNTEVVRISKVFKPLFVKLFRRKQL